MWPFKRRRNAAKLRAAFTRNLADEVVDELIKNPRPLRMAPGPAKIHFILLQVRDDPLDQAPAHMGKAFEIIVRREGNVWGIASSIALAAFGLPFEEDAERAIGQRAKSVARLVTELGSDIRLVHGTVDGLLGNLGAPEHLHHGPMLPRFSHYLAALMALEFGRSAEVPAT
ncbi:MAG TPA: hypothetical protein VFE34_18680 [Dongiaceae bacterium]|jgi:hypothetical protein|nr:hypothetical protein [Dongiaceae bacterium]